MNELFGINAFWWIVSGGVAMSLIAVAGSSTFFVLGDRLQSFLLPLVAFSAGALIGGAFLHMVPASISTGRDPIAIFLWLLIGFTLFLAIEQFLHWHHCRRAATDCKKPLTYLILLGDGLHNLIGGMAIAGTFLLDIRLGIAAWLAAAAHELPQELGDMGVLIYGGWEKKQALLFNFVSSLTFLIGGIFVYFVSLQADLWFLIPFAAGNFIYIGASDLIPEVNRHESLKVNLVHFLLFVVGLGLMLAVNLLLD